MDMIEQAAIFLLTAVLLVPLFQRLKLGAVLGYLAAGMVIGPWGLGVVAEAKATLQFAEFGIVLLLFLIGLELDPARLWALRRSVFGLGGAQVGVTGLVLALGALAFGLRWEAAVVAGAGASADSLASEGSSLVAAAASATASASVPSADVSVLVAQSAMVSISGVGVAPDESSGGSGVTRGARFGRMHCSITTSSSPGAPSQRMSPLRSSVPSGPIALSLTWTVRDEPVSWTVTRPSSTSTRAWNGLTAGRSR